MSAFGTWTAATTLLVFTLFFTLLALGLSIAALSLWTRYAYAENLTYIAYVLLACATFVFLCTTVVMVVASASTPRGGPVYDKTIGANVMIIP